MALIRNLALRIPAIRKLVQTRNALLNERQILLAKLDARQGQIALPHSPFFYYNSNFDPQTVIRRHAVANLSPCPGYVTNFLGVKIAPRCAPNILADHSGTVEPIPIPANWHADIAEWGAALRAVELARELFTVVELGCGWGCWINNTGIVARRCGLEVRLIGVEADAGHLSLARETYEGNGFCKSQVELHHGVAAAESGVALFPRQARPGDSWGLKPILNPSPSFYVEAMGSCRYDSVPMLAMADLAAPHARIDLLHVDIQGGERDLINKCMPLLQEKVAYAVIGTHARQIEGDLFDSFLRAGWRLEIERPAILSVSDEEPTVIVDGVQAWRNPLLLA